MITIHTDIKELGQNAQLLTRHDQWLEAQRNDIQTDMEEKSQELRAVLLAQRIKKELQQQNKVAVQKLVRDPGGEIKNVEIQIMALPDAIQELTSTTIDENDQLNRMAQIHGWDNDGYDITTSMSLRS